MNSSQNFESQINKLLEAGLAAKAAVAFQERRAKPRIHEPFPAQVRGSDNAGNPFDLKCLIDNISADGLSLRPLQIDRQLERGAEVGITVHFFAGATGASIEIRGQVLRTETQADGKCALALRLMSYRFL